MQRRGVLRRGRGCVRGSRAGGAGSAAAGFKWRAGNERQTVGMWMWSSPFIRRLPGSGERVAVLLLDTQGLFDMLSTQTQTAHIFGLSTLISSYQIYNVKERVQEDNLQYVALFAEYARVAAVAAAAAGGSAAVGPAAAAAAAAAASPREVPRGSTRAAPVFQRLEFLVRDFKMETPAAWADAAAAERAMGAYFASVFERGGAREGEEMRALRDTRDHILTCFERTSCFMLPHPGDAVAGDADAPYDGSVALIRERFRVAVARYVRVLFCEQLEAKRAAGGRLISVAEFTHFVEGYARVFTESGKFPEAKVLLDATADANNRAARDRALSGFHAALAAPTAHYTTHVPAARFEAAAAEAVAAALATFDTLANFGNREAVAKARRELEADLDMLRADALARNRDLEPRLGAGAVGAAVAAWFALSALQLLLDVLCAPWLSVCRRASALAAALKMLLVLGAAYVAYTAHSGALGEGGLADAILAALSAAAGGAMGGAVGKLSAAVAGVSAAAAAAGQSGRSSSGAGGASDAAAARSPLKSPNSTLRRRAGVGPAPRK